METTLDSQRLKTPNQALSVLDTARRLAISKSRLYELIAEGSITARRLGGRTIFLDSDIEAFLASLPVKEPTKLVA